MSEKRVEILLSEVLQPFNQENIYYSPNENDELKEIFKHASKKTDNGNGIPDRLYFDENVLIVFECKAININDAVRDLKIYKSKISNRKYILLHLLKIFILYMIIHFQKYQKKYHQYLVYLNISTVIRI